MRRFVLIISCLLFSTAIADNITPNTESVTSEKDQLEERYHQAIKSEDFKHSARIQALDKVTAHISNVEVPLNDAIRFRSLEIELLRCWKAPAEQDPENKALLKIYEHIPGQRRKEIFFGWVFSSSPALSALEHPIYDITLLECIAEEVTEETSHTNSPFIEEDNTIEIVPEEEDGVAELEM